MTSDQVAGIGVEKSSSSNTYTTGLFSSTAS